MKKLTSKAGLTILLVILLGIQPAVARELFGNAQVEKGALEIVRNGETLTVNAQEPVEIQKNDLVMVGSDSLVNWQIDQSKTLQLGSNAILMLQAWKWAGSSGYLNLAYGIAKVQLSAGEGSIDPVVLKTPSAIIRLTGSVWVQVTSTGSTMVKTLTGETKLSDLLGETRLLAVNKLALVVNGDLIIPDADASAELQQLVDPEMLNAPGFGKSQASFLINEAEMLAAGILTDDAVQQSKNVEVSIDESFDEQIDTLDGREKKHADEQPISEDLATELDIQDEMESIEVDSESDELGVIQVMVKRPKNVYTEFDKPKTPGIYFDLDDKTTWSLESGLIAVTIEK